MILEKALNKRILDKIEKLKKKDSKVYCLLREALWREYLERNKQAWHYSQWYLKQIEKEAAKED